MRTLIIILLIAVAGCKTDHKKSPPIHGKELKDGLVRANKVLHQNEEDAINSYVERAGWNMITTPTGVRIQVYEKGDGKIGIDGSIAVFNYELKLITGKLCYSSKDSGTKQFMIGNNDVEVGLNEAMLLLHEGDRAKIILPSHLALGLVGDEDCIPRKATLIYDVEVIQFLEKPLTQ